MHINGFEFVEVTPSRLVNSDRDKVVRIIGDDRGWQVSVSHLVVSQHPTFGDACIAAVAQVAAQSWVDPDTEWDFTDGQWVPSATEDTTGLAEYRNQRLNYT